MHTEPPGCGNYTRCREIVISGQVPLELALPLYGYAMPVIVAVTILTNSFIVLVLSQRYLRTPTNYVLLAMAVTELLTGLSSLPWLLYYYTFEGYRTDASHGLPPFWCFSFQYMAMTLPSIFHAAAIWLTVYLAAQRYIYICVPKMVRSHCTIRRSKQAITVICIVSTWIYAPEFFATYNQTFFVRSIHHEGGYRRACMRIHTSFLYAVGSNVYHYTIFGIHTVLCHSLPCILLVIFTWKLIGAIRVADKRHAYLIARSGTTTRKCTVESVDAATAEQRKKSFKLVRNRDSFSETKKFQGLKQNTRMLIAVIILFLITEIPAAVIFMTHVLTVAFRFEFIKYAVLNKLLIVRNVLIVTSYPFRFAIYCGMSQQFREVVRLMLTHRIFFPCSKRAQTLMRGLHHGQHAHLLTNNNLNGTTINTNEITQFSDDRKYSAIEF